MPQVTVYVREDDLDRWKAIEKKSEWLHNALNAEIPDKDIEALTCPNGHILSKFGKCMEKGCKYAK